MSEQRYKVEVYDENASGGYCVLDLSNPSQTARLRYNNVFIGTKEGCDIVCRLLNEKENDIERLSQHVKIYQEVYVQLRRELQSIYDSVTLTKAIKLIDEVYDGYLDAKPSDTSALEKRKAIIECSNKLREFREDIE